VFTAAAPLPKTLSDEFEKRSIDVIEGWGLTETSPCCTVNVVERRGNREWLASPFPVCKCDWPTHGEIHVTGPNVMTGYYKNPKKPKRFSPKMGGFGRDVGEFTELGLRLISRKDRIFKLSNAESRSRGD